MTKKVKKYRGKLTKQIISFIRHEMIKKVTQEPFNRFKQQLYQKMVEACPNLSEQMKVLADPALKDYIYPSHRVRLEGEVTDENSGRTYTTYEYIELPYPYAKKRGTELCWTNQEYFDKYRALIKKEAEIYAFFHSPELKHFVGKSLNNFFEYFPQLEEYYKPVGTKAPLAPYRAPVPVDLIDKVTKRITQLLTPLPEGKPEKPKKGRRKKNDK